MADVVQLRLERMVDELEDLERRGIFSRPEIALIVKKRRNFEYRLKRHSPLKQDFLAYIDYEKQLDALRILRNKALSRHLKKRFKKSISDYAAVNRILRIYRSATSRFKGDIHLWFQYLEFCRQKKHGRVKKVLAQAIRFHPKVAGVWIYAAAWEFDNNLNATAARALMQSGLRVCPTSEDMWIEYLRLELTYLNKLKARKVALGEDEGTLILDHKDPDEKQWRDENKDLFMSLDEEKENNVSKLQNVDSEEKLDLFREQSFHILKTVYSGATEALPHSFSLHKRIFEIFEAIDLAHSEDMREEIMGTMKQEFSKEPEYWDWLARHEMNNPRRAQDMDGEINLQQLEKAVQVYEEALTIVPSATMFNLYSNFLMDVIDPKREKSDDSAVPKASDHMPDFCSRLLKVYEKAETTGCLTDNLAHQYVSFHLQLGRLDEARKLAEKLCSGRLSHAVDLWVSRISIEMRCVAKTSPPSKTDVLSVFELFRTGLTKVAVSEAESLWHMALKFYANQKHYLDKLVEISIITLANDGGREDGFSLSSMIVNFILQREGVDRAREIYKRYLVLPRPGVPLYRSCITLELNLANLGDKDSLVNARKLYETALTTYNQDTSLWQDYYSMEIKLGTAETASGVYWRARKVLKAALVDTPGLP